MFDATGAAIYVTLPELPQGYGGPRIFILEGQSTAIRFDRTDITQEASFAFRPLPEQSGVTEQFGYDPTRPPVIHFVAGETGPKFLTIGAVENTTSESLPATQWRLEPVSGISRFGGAADLFGELLEIFFLNNDVSAGPDHVVGGVGNNVFAPGGAGNDSFAGSYGIDTVTLQGLRSEYAIVPRPARFGTPQVVDQVEGRDGIDDLFNVERIRFADGTLALDTIGNAGQAYRLYQAAFARDPDLPGLVHQIGALDNGLGLNTISANFLASAEFITRFGAASSDAEFVTLLYRNGLGREPDEPGFQAHAAGLAGGMSRDQLLINFSESTENWLQVGLEIGDGIWLG
jgi:hypothetical protein